MLCSPLKLAFASVLGSVAILVVAWTVDGVFVCKVWPEGSERLRAIFAAELGRESGLATRKGGAPGIHDMGVRFAAGAALSIPDTIVRSTYIANRRPIEVGMLRTQRLGVRFATLTLLLPLLVLIYVVAAADGLTQRAIRRASGERESASLYHRAKHLQVVAAATGVLVGLLWPAVVDAHWIAMALTATLGVLARVQWAYYKKHL